MPETSDSTIGNSRAGDTSSSGAQQAAGNTRALDSGLACIALMAQVFELAVEPAQIAHKQGKTVDGSDEPFDETDILQALTDLDLKARAVEIPFEQLAHTPLPAIAQGKDGRYFIIAKLVEENSNDTESADETEPVKATQNVLVQEPDGTQLVSISASDVQARWCGESGVGKLILVTRRAQVGAADKPFDVTWFIPAVVKYRKLFGEVLLASLFLQLFALITPLFFQVIIDKVLTHRGLTTLDVLIFGLIVISIFEVALGGLRTYLFSHTTQRIDVTLGARLFRHLLALPLAYFGARRVGDTVARVRELETIRNFLTGSALTLVIDLGFTFVFFGVMYYFAPLLTYIVLGSIPFYIILSLAITPVLRRRIEDKFQRGATNQAFLVESITGVETLKAMAVEPQMQRRWEEQLAGYVKSSFLAQNLGNWAGQGVQLIQKITMALTLYYGAKLVIATDLTVGQLVAFNMLSGRVAQPILRLAQLWQDFQQARISVERLGDILNVAPEPSQSTGRGTLPTLAGHISFDQVTFRYRADGPEILKRVSVDLGAGQVVGIVGPSGSGKSTFAKLIQRLYVPESGRVLIDGTDLAVIDPASLRRQVGVVLQENVLFNRSIRDNIALAHPSLCLEAITEAAKLAGAHEFILELPEGYDTVVGERGASLSGGQRQRIAIARALVSNPRILIFDEATSALDYESELAIQTNMKRICAGRTVVIIAHRLTAVRDCDRILTIEKGEVVEDGAHAELLKTGGRYARLWATQSSGREEPTDNEPPPSTPATTAQAVPAQTSGQTSGDHATGNIPGKTIVIPQPATKPKTRRVAVNPVITKVKKTGTGGDS